MEVVLLIAGLAGLAWGAVFLRRGNLLDGCLAVLLAIACFGHPFLQIPGPLPLTIDRLALLGAIGVCLVQRRLGWAPAVGWTRFDLLVAGWVLLLLVSMAYGQWRGGTTPPLDCFWQWFLGYATPALVYFVARHARLGPGSLRRAYAALALFGVYLGLIGICEVTQNWALVFPRYISDPKIGLHFGRARGPMIHSVSYGVYLCVALGAAWLLAWRGGLARRWQLVVLLTMPAQLAGIYLSYTRSVWIGAGLAVLTVLTLTLRGRWRWLFLASALAGSLLLVATQMNNLMEFKREFTAAETRDSAQVREVFVYISWLMFQDRPLLGVGFGQFRTEKLPYLVDRQTDLRLQAVREWVHHNNYLGILTETGLLGLGWFLALVAALAWTAARGWRAPEMPAWAKTHCLLMLAVLGVWVAQLAFHELSFSPLDNSLVLFLAGLTVSLVEAYLPREAPTTVREGVFEDRVRPGWPSLGLRHRLLGRA